MKRLILIRHAKSSWDTPFDDHARTLNDRGREAATAVGVWLRDNEYMPDTIYSSDAARTRETTDQIVASLGQSPTIVFKDTMYHGSPTALMKVLHGASGDTVALVAHNPGIAFFAEEIVADKPDHARFFDYPTCATLVCEFAINDWAEAVSHSGQVVNFVVPKDLN